MRQKVYIFVFKLILNKYLLLRSFFWKFIFVINSIAVVAAVTATLIHDAISNPTEVIKQRLQMYNSPYRTILQCAHGVYRTEGLKAFYRSYVTQLCMNLPHQTIHFSTYEFFQNKVIIACLKKTKLIGTPLKKIFNFTFYFVSFS